MKNLLRALLVMACWSPAMASQTFEYRLIVDSCVVTSTNPYAPPGSACNALTLNALRNTTVVLDSSPAAYEYVQHNGVVTVSDTGFDEIIAPNSRRVPGVAVGYYYPVPSGGPAEFLCGGDCDLKVTASDAGAPILDAMFALNTQVDTFLFSWDEAKGIGTGRLASDYPPFGGAFTGHLALIPEPSSSALTILGSLALILVRLAKRRSTGRPCQAPMLPAWH